MKTDREAGKLNGAQCMLRLSRCANRAVTQLYDSVLAPTGLKSTQFLTLKAIHDSGEIAQHVYSRTYLVAAETLSRNFASLRRKGLIAARTGAKREQIYTLTDKGLDTFSAALPYWDRAQNRLKTVLGACDWQLFLDLCDRVAISANTLIEEESGFSLRGAPEDALRFEAKLVSVPECVDRVGEIETKG